MPVARGMMIMDRITVYNTAASFTSIVPSSGALCGDTITFHVQVVNINGAPTPTGTVFIIETVTNTLVGSATLSGGTATIVTTLTHLANSLVVSYPGVVNHFAPSVSAATEYDVSIINTTTSFLTAPGHYACYTGQPFTITASVTPNVGVSHPSGTVEFRLYSDNTNFISLPSATLDGFGHASVTLTGTSVPGDYWVQALYDGYGCFNNSQTAYGTSGLLVHEIANDITTTNISLSGGGNTFCVHTSATFLSSTTATNLPNPSIGSVNFYSIKGPTITLLGTSSIAGGNASITIPGNHFDTSGGWFVYADYVSDGYCYNFSESSFLGINPTEWATVTGVSGPTNFCYATSQIFSVIVASSTTGTMGGTVTLFSSSGTNLGSTALSGPNSGTIVHITVPGYSFSPTDTYAYAVFTTNLTGCYASSTSSHYAVTVQSNSTQTTNSSGVVTPSSGDTRTNFSITLTIAKNSGQGPVDGAGGLAGTGSVYWYPPGGGFSLLTGTVHIVDMGTFGQGTYNIGELPAGTNNFVVQYNGNDCYAGSDSVFIPVVVTVFTG